MDNAVNITEAMLRKLAAPSKGELRLHDKKVPGLMLRWRAGGTARWYLYKRVRDRMVQSALGELSSWPAISVETARESATRALADLGKGIAPSDTRKATRQEKADKAAQVVPLSEVWKLHKKDLLADKRCAEHIREMELLAINAEAAGINDLRHPSVATRAENWLSGLGLAPSTTRRRRGFFKSLGDTAQRWWKLQSNPFAALKLAKAGTLADIELFTMPECFALMSDEGMHHKWGALGAVLLYHGLRLQEGVWLHWDRIDTERELLRITPPTSAEWELGYRVKRNKSREVTLQEECLKIMEALPKQDDGYLFPAEFRTLNRKIHWRNFHAWCKSVGVDPGTKHPHTLRHQRATVGLASNEGEMRLQLSLGHAGAAMTVHYAQQANRLKKALGHWHGVMRFRDPAEISRLTPATKQPKTAMK